MIKYLRSTFSRRELGSASLVAMLLWPLSTILLMQILNLSEQVAAFIGFALTVNVCGVLGYASRCQNCGKVPMRTSYFGSSSWWARYADAVQAYNRVWPEVTCSRCNTDLRGPRYQND